MMLRCMENPRWPTEKWPNPIFAHISHTKSDSKVIRLSNYVFGWSKNMIKLFISLFLASGCDKFRMAAKLVGRGAFQSHLRLYL